jgi:SecD/SecF fusion protein
MPTQFTGRVTLILIVLIVAVICIFPCVLSPQTIFKGGQTFQELSNLKPGIDMVGGVSLVYKIKAPEGSGPINNDTTSLSERVMEALKKRVDPDGVRNLVWRPVGNDELEIQMPLTPHAADAPKLRQAYAGALTDLQALNVQQSEVLAAVAMPAGAARDQKLDDLAMGDPNRQTLFASLASMSDQLAAARALASKPNPSAADMRQAAKVLDETGEKFDDAKTHIEDDNIDSHDLEGILDAQQANSSTSAGRLSDLNQHFAQFPGALTAIKNFEQAYLAFLPVKGTLDDAADLKNLLKGSGVLEFHIVAWDQNDPKYREMFDRMRPGGRGPSAQPGDDTYRWYEMDRPDEFAHGYPIAKWNDKGYMLLLITPESSMTKSQPWALERSYPTSDDMGQRVVGFTFDTNGGHLFGDLTTRWQPNNGKQSQLAVVLDDKLVSAPNINGPINAGSGYITGGQGGFSDADFTYLINTLNAGSLPAQLEDEPISERRVGSTLGADNLHKGLVACGFGLIVVGVFLIGYYYVAGFVAFCAVLMNLLIILGVMAAFNATFTLPSIAGIVLTVGTAVDANVLIFERLREEQHRGLPLRMALRNSYDRAFSAIIDSNMTSLITSVFLYWFGSEEVKGFGLTLIIGIIASLFTALFVTKTVFGILIEKFGVKNLSSFPLTFPKWDKLLKPNIDWMGLAWGFYTFSIIGITSGMILFGYYAHLKQMLDIDFAAGTSVEFELVKPMPIGQVRQIIGSAPTSALPSPSVVSLGTDETAYQVVTPNETASQVRQAVVNALGPLLQAQLPSRFIGVDDKTVAEAMAQKVIFPIPADLHQWPAALGKPPAQASRFPGGVVIQMSDLTPPIKPADIKSRIDGETPQVTGADKISDLLVLAPTPDDVPTRTALVLVGNPAITYSPEHEGDWREDLATPAWNLVKGSVNHEAALRGVNSFNASVAGDTRRDALIALTLSILVIMAYIWVRFGNLKYGTATVVALIHDTFFTIAALGFAHLLADSAIGGVLQLEPFRINLTVVAGVLTIMGYSMIDTIVVFDRIRENRGKYGYLSRTVINDAINQTLSRTLLTAGTTTITVAFMYFLGGSGIHGFTFVLLIGILVGTYSSIAIAAPILLVGAEKDHTVPPDAAQQQLTGVA